MKKKRFYIPIEGFRSLRTLSPGTLLRFYRLISAIRRQDDAAAWAAAVTFSVADRARFRRFLQEVKHNAH